MDELTQRIREYRTRLETEEEAYQRERKEIEEHKGVFIDRLVQFFTTPEIVWLLQNQHRRITLFAHYGSSVGAAMTGGKPSYEITVSGDGLQVLRDGSVEKQYPLPAEPGVWNRAIPYGGLFHDSSVGDYNWKPSVDYFMDGLEKEVARWLE
jgi:hypothetical protein